MEQIQPTLIQDEKMIANPNYIDFRKLEEGMGFVDRIKDTKIDLTTIPKHLLLNDIDEFMRAITSSKDIIKKEHLTSVMDNVYKELNFISLYMSM